MSQFNKLIALNFTCLVLLFTANSTSAQNYSFRVDKMHLQVYVLADASVRMEYEIDFANQPGAHAIDIVDIGLPHEKYNIKNMSASIGKHKLTTIRKSEYIDVGVEVHLGAHKIPAGGKGTFHFQCTMPNMVYQDSTDKQLASLQIKPTWFDSKSTIGKSDLRIAVHMLPTVKAEDAKYQNEKTKYTDLVLYGEDDKKHVVAIWQYKDHRLDSNNPKVGVSFPQAGMDRVVKSSAFQLLVKWFSESKGVQFVSGLILAVAFLFLFVRFSNGTGWVLFFLLGAMLVWIMISSPALHLITWPAMIGLIAFNEWFLSTRKSDGYLPAMATVEGGGIKRGLTAPQAGILLEMPLGKVLSLVVFGMLKKGLIRIVNQSPLTVEVANEYQCPRKERLKMAASKGNVIHGYEHPFLDRLQACDKPVTECNLGESLGSLINSTATRMKGFDLWDTKDYYRRIVQRAWKDAESIGEIEQRTKVVDQNIEWMMMDPTWDSHLDDWAQRGYSYRPIWIYGNSPTGSFSGSSVPQSPTSTSPTSFGEVASSFAGWAENTAGSFAGAIEPGSLGIDLPKGVVDLSAVDKVTGDVFEALAESAKSGGGGGGGGGGCACACAGCACACACAGGGR